MAWVCTLKRKVPSAIIHGLYFSYSFIFQYISDLIATT